MAETSLISKTDVRVYRDIDPKIVQARFDAFVYEVQRKNLRELLGKALYYDFMLDDRISGKYEKLLNGEVYTIDGETVQFYGIKPALCLWWLAVASREGDMFHSGYGAIQFSNNQQQSFESAKEKNRMVESYMSTAQSYANDIINYLNEKNSTYPLWVCDSEEKENKFLTFRI